MRASASIHPVQPFFLVNTTRYYKTRASRAPIVHFYSFTADLAGESAETRHSAAVPDGCVDILFTECGGELFGELCGMVTRSYNLELPVGSRCFGARFLPGYLPGRFDISIPELVNNRVPLTELGGGAELLDRVARTSGFAERVALLGGFFGENWRAGELLQLLIASVCESGGEARVKTLEDKTLYSARYLHRVFTEQLGLSTKAFCEHVRFQTLISRLNSGGAARRLSAVAADSGYYDQPHLIHEFKDFTGVTPGKYYEAVDFPRYYSKIVYV